MHLPRYIGNDFPWMDNAEHGGTSIGSCHYGIRKPSIPKGHAHNWEYEGLNYRLTRVR